MRQGEAVLERTRQEFFTKRTPKLFCKSGQFYKIDLYLVRVLFDPYPVQRGQTGWQTTHIIISVVKHTVRRFATEIIMSQCSLVV